jgi:peptidoglycan/xylan/chitin deacetylase (PgdA/CDA1 family)
MPGVLLFAALVLLAAFFIFTPGIATAGTPPSSTATTLAALGTTTTAPTTPTTTATTPTTSPGTTTTTSLGTTATTATSTTTTSTTTPGTPPAPTPPAADISDGPAPTISLDPIGASWPALSRLVSSGPTSRRWVTLTFDDDYNPALSLSVLRTLRLTATPATLFLIGAANLESQAIVNAIASDPLLEVGDHSLHHVELTGHDADFLQQNIGGGVETFRQMTGAHTSHFFRPPGGHSDSLVLDIAAKKGFLETVSWTYSPGDYLGISADAIVSSVMSQLRPGAIILLHFNAANTANALPTLIREIKASGYRLVTLSQLLKGSRTFYDVLPDDPAYDAITYMNRTGFLKGFPTGDYGATEGLSRQDLARALVLGLGFHTAEVDTSHPTFTDVLPPSSDTAPGSGSQMAHFDYIEEAVAHGLMQGGKGGGGKAMFWPTATVRRIDLALAIAKALGLPTTPITTFDATTTTTSTAVQFTDVPAQAQAAVAAVVAAGFMSADGDTFRPYDPESRAHAARVLQRLFDSLGTAP